MATSDYRLTILLKDANQELVGEIDYHDAPTMSTMILFPLPTAIRAGIAILRNAASAAMIMALGKWIVGLPGLDYMYM